MRELKIFSGRANPQLARDICGFLHLNLGSISLGKFPDGENFCKIDDDVRGRDVFLIQPTSPPVNDNLMELLIMIDSCKRASAAKITAVIPYFGYARQDRRVRSARVPITAKVVADFLSSVGVDRVLTVDLHAEQIQGFFDVPVDNVFASPVLLDDMRWRGGRPEGCPVTVARVAKNKHGSTGRVMLRWTPQFTLFEDADAELQERAKSALTERPPARKWQQSEMS